jgi:hypothetical protein
MSSAASMSRNQSKMKANGQRIGEEMRKLAINIFSMKYQ